MLQAVAWKSRWDFLVFQKYQNNKSFFGMKQNWKRRINVHKDQSQHVKTVKSLG